MVLEIGFVVFNSTLKHYKYRLFKKLHELTATKQTLTWMQRYLEIATKTKILDKKNRHLDPKCKFLV